MHIAKVSFDAVADPDDLESQVIVARCLRQQFRPDHNVSIGEDVILYDMKERIEAPGIIHHIEGDIVEVVIPRKTVKHLKVLNSELEPEAIAPEDILKSPGRWYKRSLFGLLSFLLAVLFSVIFVQAYEVITTAFLLESVGLGPVVQDLAQTFSPESSPYVMLGTYSWAVLWIPIMALLCANLHWRMGGDMVTGALGSFTSAVTATVSFVFGLTWLVIQGIIPIPKEAIGNATSSNEPGIMWGVLVSCFIVALALSMAGAARRR